MSYQQPQYPGWGQPQPPAPKKPSTGKIVGFSCLGVIGVLVVLVVLASLFGGTDEGSASGSGPAVTRDAAPSGEAEDAKAEEAGEKPVEAEPAKDAPVTVTAKKVAFKKSVLADGGDYTSVRITIANGGDKDIEVNPLYFTITDTSGGKHTAELGTDEDQIDTVQLAPGENITGTVTGKGTFTPKYVTYTDGLFGEGVRGDVS
ncbi:DUF4352 domain-containing protein [Streptomyces sp. NPDC059883]|uniref:DUF4352 domain-containing protein n=1 Tax=unclassified Streptomyces TaxID=2593676 RepID=UPI00364DA06A